jgi:hypothetical protein
MKDPVSDHLYFRLSFCGDILKFEVLIIRFVYGLNLGSRVWRGRIEYVVVHEYGGIQEYLGSGLRPISSTPSFRLRI